MQSMASLNTLALAVFLASCGGGGGTNPGPSNPSASGVEEKLEKKAPEPEKETAKEENKDPTAPEAEGVKKTATWINLSPDASGLTTQGNGNPIVFQKVSPDATTQFDTTVDGLVVNVDGDFEQYRPKVLAALEEGLVVVLDSSGSEMSQSRIQQLSYELTHMGAKAAAVMLYKGGPDESIGLFAFGNDEKTELVSLMNKVGRRGSETPKVQ